MNKFRLLRADEIECRVSQIYENGLVLLLYKTARTDANLLDETVGPENWENDFSLIDGVLYGCITIFCQGEYEARKVTKCDAGTESFTEAEKGRASDAFKRAGFKWGIGRELYTAPFIWIGAEKCNIKEGRNGKLVCNDKFTVTNIEYNDKDEISKLNIARGTESVFAWTLGSGSKVPTQEVKRTETAPKTPAGEFKPTCAMCGKEISDKVHDYSVKKFGKPLCMDCQKK